MKKHNEGYALPFVLVVIAVLTLVALSISSIAMNNLNNQKTSIQRMQDKYVAQGRIERFVSQLDTIIIYEYEQTESNPRYEIQAATYIGDFENLNVVLYEYKKHTDATSGTFYTIKVKLSSQGNTVNISCDLLLTSKSDFRYPYNESTPYYVFKNATYSYESYTITNLDPVAGETEGGGLDAA